MKSATAVSSFCNPREKCGSHVRSLRILGVKVYICDAEEYGLPSTSVKSTPKFENRGLASYHAPFCEFIIVRIHVQGRDQEFKCATAIGFPLPPSRRWQSVVNTFNRYLAGSLCVLGNHNFTLVECTRYYSVYTAYVTYFERASC